MEGLDIVKLKGFPTIKCPVCSSWLCNAGGISVKKETAAYPIEEQETLKSENINAEFIIKCPKCKSFIALEKVKSEKIDKLSTA